MKSMEQLIAVGQVDSSDTLGTTLLHSAYVGNKRALKKVLDKGIHVDYPNDEGQTPLFCACLGGHESAVTYLLSSGADPNEKTNQGLTALHATCYSGNVRILMNLLKEGGDLRLHDHQGRSVKDWAMLNPTPKKRMKILEFLDKTRMFAMSSSGQDLLMRKASSKTLHRAHHRRNTVTRIIRERIGRPSISNDLERMAASQHSLGFGHVYSNGTEKTGFMSAIPLVNEHNLKHDPVGETYNNGAFCVMESAWWDYSQVTVKRLHRELDPYQGGVVDLLINEVDHIGKLRHPNVLTLMGVCQTSNLDGLIVIYERISGGSLYNFLHQKMERLHSRMIDDIALQICDAIIFIHLQGLIHCAISSHAISVINSHTFKLGNFEYMIEASKCEWGKKNAVASNTVENAVYNWMAPEVMFSMPQSFYCDMFSFCAVLWEALHGDVPWDNQCSENIKSQYSKGDGLKVSNGKISEYYKIILDFGLQQDPTQRQLSFLHVRDLLLAAPKDAKSFVKVHFQHLHHHDDDGGSQSRSGSRPDPANRPRDQPNSNQTSTSRNIESDQADRQRRKDKERHRPDRGNRECKRGMEADNQYGAFVNSEIKKQMKGDNNGWKEERAVEADLPKARREDRSISENYNRRTPTKTFRQLHYSTDGISWEGVPKQVGGEFQYTVNVIKENSPAKVSDVHRQSHYRREETYSPREQFRSSKYKDSSGTETSEDYKTKTHDSTDTGGTCTSSDVPVGREVERKTSSMGKFSYLALDSHLRTRSAGAKPACHGQYEAVAEEYTTSGKLTTAGSLYSLYNDHSSNLPLGQVEMRRGHPNYVTLPRRKKQSIPLVEADPSWFGGRGSVRNLAQVFQDQIKQHTYNQAVLDGTVNKDYSTGQSIYSCVDNNKEVDYGNHANAQKTAQGIKFPTPGSVESVSSSLTATDNGMNNINQIAFDIDDDTESLKSTKSSSSFTTGTSSDSHAVSNWIDHELRKIKRKISKEMMSKRSLNTIETRDDFNHTNVLSPELFDNSDNHVDKIGGPLLQKDSGDGISSSECTEVTPEPSDTSLTYNDRQTGDHVKCAHMDEFYYDDELYPSSRSEQNAPNKSSPWNSHLTSPVQRSQTYPRSRHSSRDYDKNEVITGRSVKTNLPMQTVLKETESPSKKFKHVISSKTDESTKRMSRIPTSRSKLTGSNSRTKEDAFANIMTVRSSLDDLGRHQVTHQVKNLKTGGSSTMLNKLVNGQKIVTKFKAMS